MEIDITFRRSCIDRTRAGRLAESFGKVIAAITTEPYSGVYDIDLIIEEDLRYLWEWNHEVPSAVD
jgi:hypothetical protein